MTTTITSTAGALVRKKGGVLDTAVSETASNRVEANPLSQTTDIHVGVAVPSRTKVTKTNTRVTNVGVGDGVSVAFVGHWHVAVPANAVVKVAGSAVTVTSITGPSNGRQTITLAAAPVAAAAIKLYETYAVANIDDAAVAGTAVQAANLTKTNH